MDRRKERGIDGMDGWMVRDIRIMSIEVIDKDSLFESKLRLFDFY